MGSLLSKHNSENAPKTVRSRTYSGSTTTKRSSLFRSLSNKKDIFLRKSATIHATSRDAVEPTSEAVVASVKSPRLQHKHESKNDASDEQIIEQSASLAEEAIVKATGDLLLSKELREQPEVAKVVTAAAESTPTPTGENSLGEKSTNDVVTEVINVSVDAVENSLDPVVLEMNQQKSVPEDIEPVRAEAQQESGNVEKEAENVSAPENMEPVTTESQPESFSAPDGIAEQNIAEETVNAPVEEIGQEMATKQSGESADFEKEVPNVSPSENIEHATTESKPESFATPDGISEQNISEEAPVEEMCQDIDTKHPGESTHFEKEVDNVSNLEDIEPATTESQAEPFPTPDGIAEQTMSVQITEEVLQKATNEYANSSIDEIRQEQSSDSTEVDNVSTPEAIELSTTELKHEPQNPLLITDEPAAEKECDETTVATLSAAAEEPVNTQNQEILQENATEQSADIQQQSADLEDSTNDTHENPQEDYQLEVPSESFEVQEENDQLLDVTETETNQPAPAAEVTSEPIEESIDCDIPEEVKLTEPPAIDDVAASDSVAPDELVEVYSETIELQAGDDEHQEVASDVEETQKIVTGPHAISAHTQDVQVIYLADDTHEHMQKDCQSQENDLEAVQCDPDAESELALNEEVTKTEYGALHEEIVRAAPMEDDQTPTLPVNGHQNLNGDSTEPHNPDSPAAGEISALKQQLSPTESCAEPLSQEEQV